MMNRAGYTHTVDSQSVTVEIYSTIPCRSALEQGPSGGLRASLNDLVKSSVIQRVQVRHSVTGDTERYDESTTESRENGTFFVLGRA